VQRVAVPARLSAGLWPSRAPSFPPHVSCACRQVDARHLDLSYLEGAPTESYPSYHNDAYAGYGSGGRGETEPPAQASAYGPSAASRGRCWKAREEEDRGHLHNAATYGAGEKDLVLRVMRVMHMGVRQTRSRSRAWVGLARTSHLPSLLPSRR
jgi:hypothetical protein